MSTAHEKRWFAAVASLEFCVLCGAYGIQVAHSNRDRGMGQKAPPDLTAALCPACHHEIDNGHLRDQGQRGLQLPHPDDLYNEAMGRVQG